MIKYRKGYKYQLAKDYSIEVMVFPQKNITTKFIDLTVSGQLTVKNGYAWDGPSGPTCDTKNSMRGSLVHDALYQLMREERIGQEWRLQADVILWNIIREDGMNWLRAKIWYREVKKWAAKAANPESKKQVHEAP